MDFNNSAAKETSKRLHCIPNLPDITSDTFFKVFPFCVLFDPSMRITHMGKSIKSLFPYDTVVNGRHLDEIFRLVRPDIPLEWNNVIEFDLFLHSSSSSCISLGLDAQLWSTYRVPHGKSNSTSIR